MAKDLATFLHKYKSACIAIAVLTLVLAVKNVKQRRDVDFRLNYHVKQVTKEEFESQKVETTAQELDKLKASSEFQRMAMTKGQTVENWNW